MQSEQSVLSIKPISSIKYLSIIAVSLVVANLFFNFVKYITGDRFFYGLVPLFQLSAEYNIPTFFSGGLFITSSVLLILIWKAFYINEKPQLIWLFLSALFLFLAFDELFKVHELLIEPVRNSLGTSGFLYFSWVIIYGAGVVIITLFVFPIWRRLYRKVKIWFAFSAITFLLGAIGFEMIGGAYFESVERQGDLIYGILYTIEETLEMAGLIMFIYGLLILIQIEFNGIAVYISRNNK